MQLNKIQDSFQDHMLRTNQQIDENFAALFQSGNIPLNERMRVYRDNIIGGLVNVLSEKYPTVQKLVGEEFMFAMARTYIRENLPQNGCLDDYASGFPSFIEAFEPAQSLPYLADIAQLDCAIDEAEHAPDDDPLAAIDLEKLMQSADIAENPLPLRANITLIASPYPILSIFEYTHDPNQDSTIPPNLDNNPQSIMVYRLFLKAEKMALQPDEFFILAQLQEYNSLGEAIDLTVKHHTNFDFSSFLQKFINLETFQKIKRM